MNLRSTADERLNMTQWGCSRGLILSPAGQAHMKTINYVSLKLSLHWVIHLWNELFFFLHHLSVWREGYYFLMREFFLYAPGYKVNHWNLARWCVSPISNDIEKSSLSLSSSSPHQRTVLFHCQWNLEMSHLIMMSSWSILVNTVYIATLAVCLLLHQRWILLWLV